MGVTSSRYLSNEQIERFENESFFTKPEIIRVLDVFAQRTATKPGANPAFKKLTLQEFANLPELYENPFRDRIARVFANDRDEVGFPEFLDFLSVFSEEASREVKTYYAFKIYDFDEDGYLSTEDVTILVRKLVGINLRDEEIQSVVAQVMDEADLDGQTSLSFVEFEHIVGRAPNFLNTFHIAIE